MTRIRLMRVGRRNQCSYRIVVADSRCPRDGKFIEVLGHFDISKHKQPYIKVDRFEYWLSRGSQPTSRVKALYRMIKKKEVKDNERAFGNNRESSS